MQQILKQHFPVGLAELIWEFAQAPEPYEPWARYFWQEVPPNVDGYYDDEEVPEFVDGYYGHVPMCPIAAEAFVTS